MGLMKSALNFLGLKNSDGSGTGGTTGSVDEFLAELVSKMGYDIRFSATETDEGIRYDIDGEDLEAFLGESCEMLEALAHISMRYARKVAAANGLEEVKEPKEGEDDAEFKRGRIFFECGDFRQRKSEDIRKMANEKRQRVIDSGRPVYISALGPADRKVIHTFLSETGTVVSESIGSGYFKRIRLRLKDAPAHSEGGGGRRHGGGRDGGGRSFGNGGGRRGGRGPGGGRRDGGRGPRPNRGPDNRRSPNNDFESTFMNFHDEPNGNVAPRDSFSEDDVNDNIGNRLQPGEDRFGQRNDD